MNVNDYVVVSTVSDEFKGIILESKNPEKIILKLDSGYNISLNKKDIKETKVLSSLKKEKRSISKLKENPSLPTILILHTGGTIASRVDYKTGAVNPAFSPEEILEMFPDLQQIANIKSRLISNMFSEDINFNHYNLIASEIEKESNIKGIIITHGTDTLHYTSAALSFMLDNLQFPVIIVGAQRSSDRGSSDAFLNLYCACKFIAETDYCGVAICMHQNLNDDNCVILPSLKTKKLHSSRRDAFKPVNAEEIAIVNKKQVNFIIKDYPKASNKKLIIKNFKDVKVGILMAHPNMKAEEISNYKNFDGLIIEGTGIAGNFPINKIDSYTEENEKIYNELKKLAKKIPVAATTQTIFGRVNMNVYSTGIKMQEIGILGNLLDMTTETAFIKLAFLLSNYPKEVRKLYSKNLKGEISSRINEKFLD